MRPNESRAVARYHRQGIPGGVLAQLAPETLARIYRALNETGDGFVFVAVDQQERVVGFVAGVTHLSRVYRRIIGAEPWHFARIGMRYMFSAGMVRRLFDTLYYPARVGSTHVDAELLSIVVDAGCHGSGVAGDLLRALLAEFDGRGIDEIKVMVGANLDRANAYYKKYGFRFAGQIDRHGQPANIYTIRTSERSPLRPPFSSLARTPDEIEQMWYVPPAPRYRVSWWLYSRDFVLESLQGCLNQPERVRRTPGWQAVAGSVLTLAAAAQLVLMLLSVIPVLSALMYTLARSMPRGWLGFFLRGCYWKPRLGRLGVDTLIDQGVEFTRPGRIEIGSRCHVDRNVLLAVAASGGYIRVGDNTSIGPGTHVAGRGGVWIGSFVGLSANVHIYSVTNQPYDAKRLGELITMSHMAPLERQCTVAAPVRIEDHAFIGYATIVLPGVVVGRGAVVHAFAEARTSIPRFGIATGHGSATRRSWRRPVRPDPRRGGGATSPGGGAASEAEQ